MNAMETLSKEGAVPKWGSGLQDLDRRNVFIGELSRVGIKKPDLIGKPSVRNDAAFLYTLVGVTSVVAVAAGQLPGDWVRNCLSCHNTLWCIWPVGALNILLLKLAGLLRPVPHWRNCPSGLGNRVHGAWPVAIYHWQVCSSLSRLQRKSPAS